MVGVSAFSTGWGTGGLVRRVIASMCGVASLGQPLRCDSKLDSPGLGTGERDKQVAGVSCNARWRLGAIGREGWQRVEWL